LDFLEDTHMRRPARKLATAAALIVIVGTLVPEAAVAEGTNKWGRAWLASHAFWRSDSCRDAKAWVRERVVRRRDLDHYGLTCDPKWQRCAADKPLVLLLHGYNSTPQRNGALLKPLRKRGYPCAVFAFPNDQDLVASASLLSRDLKKFSRRHAGRDVVLITHSMGGLVARECVENPLLDPGNVERLIMIAPPSRGTLVAHLAVCADVWEHGLFRRGGGCLVRLKDSVIDGLAEAADDLQPGSPFLKRLNRRPRNPRVQYSLFVGTRGRIRERELVAFRTLVRSTMGNLPGLRTTARKLDRWLGNMDEVVDGKGDGVVALKRALVPGIDDVVVLPFGHLSVTGEPKTKVVRRVHQEVLARLE
jgi:pimeloyl-ACP methyl ester carboxylesterase